MDHDALVRDIGKKARAAGRIMAAAPGHQKDAALERLATLLEQRAGDIRAANEKDLEAARARDLDGPRINRLTISDAVLESMVEACRDVACQADPVGEVDTMWKRPNGLLVGKMRIPLGVIAMIYESRPNVTVDASILCLKAGNAVVLRGGSEAFHSNTVLAEIIHQALADEGLPGEALQLLPTTDRAAVSAMLKLDEYIDVIIPRGGEGLIRAVVDQATMPVLKHYKGVCHAYVDEHADLQQALEVVFNAKVHRPGVCNALEGLLVHEKVAAEFLPLVDTKLGEAGVEFRVCPRSRKYMGDRATAASDEDYGTEFHDLILTVVTVDDQDEAQDYIARYGSNHTEIICTRDHDRAMRFVNEVDASMVAVNASSRFNDGGELGLGAEIGISTSKLHSYGPMGVKELTSTKFVVFGQGHVRS